MKSEAGQPESRWTVTSGRHGATTATTSRSSILDVFDDWVARGGSGRRARERQPEPGLDPTSQWDSDLRLKDMESQGVVAEVLFPNGLPFQAQAGGRRRLVRRPRDRPAGAPGLQPLAGRLLRADPGPPGRPGPRLLRRRRPGGRGHPLGQGARPGRRHDARPAARRDLLLRPRARPGLGRLRRGRPARQPARRLGCAGLRAARVRRHHDPGARALLLLGALAVADDPGRRVRALPRPAGRLRRDRGATGSLPSSASWTAACDWGDDWTGLGPDAAAHAPVHGLGPRLLGRQLLRRHLTLHRRPGPARRAGPAERRLRGVRHRL